MRYAHEPNTKGLMLTTGGGVCCSCKERARVEAMPPEARTEYERKRRDRNRARWAARKAATAEGVDPARVGTVTPETAARRHRNADTLARWLEAHGRDPRTVPVWSPSNLTKRPDREHATA